MAASYGNSLHRFENIEPLGNFPLGQHLVKKLDVLKTRIQDVLNKKILSVIILTFLLSTILGL